VWLRLGESATLARHVDKVVRRDNLAFCTLMRTVPKDSDIAEILSFEEGSESTMVTIEMQ